MLSFLAFALLVVIASLIGVAFQPGAWYQDLAKPAWTPPSWVFAPVWTVLYVVIAIAGWLVWRAGGNRFSAPVYFWLVQLVLNAAWSWLFFGLHRPAVALVDIALLLIAIVAFIATAWRYSAVAASLFVPYAAWAAFAAVLNYSIWRLNAG